MDVVVIRSVVSGAFFDAFVVEVFLPRRTFDRNGAIT
jgi:hypothetical protein